MKTFDFSTAINQLGLDKTPVNTINAGAIPIWVSGKDFIHTFLPHLVILGDSREQDRWIGDYCEKVGIKCVWTNSKSAEKNLKEGDYTFGLRFGETAYDYRGRVAYERKGSLCEFYVNCTGYSRADKTSDRERIKRELNRFGEKKYEKVVLLLQFGKRLLDTINAEFSYYDRGGDEKTINVKNVVFSSLMSWKQPNNNSFDIIQSDDKTEMFWLMLIDMYYFFRNEIKKECYEKNLIGEENE